MRKHNLTYLAHFYGSYSISIGWRWCWGQGQRQSMGRWVNSSVLQSKLALPALSTRANDFTPMTLGFPMCGKEIRTHVTMLWWRLGVRHIECLAGVLTSERPQKCLFPTPSWVGGEKQAVHTLFMAPQQGWGPRKDGALVGQWQRTSSGLFCVKRFEFSGEVFIWLNLLVFL